MSFTLRAAMLAASNHSLIKRVLTESGFSKNLVQRFVAGETLDDAVAMAMLLHKRGLETAVDYLGENTTTEREAEAAADAYLQVLTVFAHSLRTLPYLSVKLTALGLDLGEYIASQNLNRLLMAAQAMSGAFVCVDMEGSAYTQRTLDIVRAASAEFGNVGTVLQSALRRTDDDLQMLIAASIRVRLVKGAYAEPPSIAYPDKADVDRAYLRQMQELLRHGKQAAIATHDTAILRQAKQFIREEKLLNDNFEFQMLLGIRRDLQESLASEGYNVRVYLPFGAAWYPYFVRRLAERPANIGFVLRNLMK